MPALLGATENRGVEIAYKVYSDVQHGFTTTLPNNPTATQVAMQQRAFDDTVSWLNVHSNDSPAPYAAPWTNTTMAGVPTYVFGAGTDIVLYLQDVNGVSNASVALAGRYANAGYTVYYPDYFFGGTRGNYTAAASTQRVLGVIALLRQAHPSSTIQAVGFCFGGGVGVPLMQSTDPAQSIDSGVFAHASGVTQAMINGLQRPVMFVMPQNDTGFNNPAPNYLATTIQNGVEAEYKAYPYVRHGRPGTLSHTRAISSVPLAFTLHCC